MGEVGEKVESWMEPQLWYFNQPKGVLNAIQTRISWNLDMKSLVERWQKESKIESTMTTKWLLRARRSLPPASPKFFPSPDHLTIHTSSLILLHTSSLFDLAFLCIQSTWRTTQLKKTCIKYFLQNFSHTLCPSFHDFKSRFYLCLQIMERSEPFKLYSSQWKGSLTNEGLSHEREEQ